MAETLIFVGALGAMLVAANSIYQSYKEEKKKLKKDQIVVYRFDE